MTDFFQFTNRNGGHENKEKLMCILSNKKRMFSFTSFGTFDQNFFSDYSKIRLFIKLLYILIFAKRYLF